MQADPNPSSNNEHPLRLRDARPAVASRLRNMDGVVWCLLLLQLGLLLAAAWFGA
jgi:hypothetical protein